MHAKTVSQTGGATASAEMKQAPWFPWCFRVDSYRVGSEMETDCPQCGEPVLIGDTAFEVRQKSLTDSEGFEAGFCSGSCANRWIEDYRREWIATEAAERGSI